MQLSIVIPAYDAERTLAETLSAATNQSHPAQEIIVVDNASGDDTASIARRFDCKVVSLERNLGAAGGRNAGAAVASGDILLFVDADVELPPTAVERVLSWFEAHRDYDALVGVLSEHCPFPNPASQYFNLRKRYDYMQLRQPIGVIYGGIHAIRRSVLRQIGGYDESFHEVEDADLGKRLAAAGHLIGLDHALEAVHRNRVGLWGLLRSDARRTALHVRLLLDRRGAFKAAVKGRVASFRRGAVLSVLIVPATLLAAAGSLLWWPLAIPAVAGALTVAALNWGFLSYTARVKGLATALAFGGIVVLDMLAAAAGLAWGLVKSIFGR